MAVPAILQVETAGKATPELGSTSIIISSDSEQVLGEVYTSSYVPGVLADTSTAPVAELKESPGGEAVKLPFVSPVIVVVGSAELWQRVKELIGAIAKLAVEFTLKAASQTQSQTISTADPNKQSESTGEGKGIAAVPG